MIPELAIRRVSKTYRALGTVIDLTIFGTDRDELLDRAYLLIQHYEDLLTVNRTDSEIMSVNKAAGREAVQVSSASFQLIKRAVEESQRHFGFNATIGPLVKLWHIGFSDARIPSAQEIAVRRKLINPDFVKIDEINQSIFLVEKGMELDLGAIAKGFIADRICDLWKAYGVSSGIINLGGNIMLLGEAVHQADKLWRIGIRHPLLASSETVATILTTESSVVTSGIAERTMTIADKSYHHIIDPETGYPHETELASVTVLTAHSIDGEIETTRLFFADAVLTNYPYRAIYIYKDKSIVLVGIPESRVIITNTEFYFRNKM